MKRPYPPEQDNPYADDEDLIDSGGLLHFEPANNDLWPWIEETFLCEWGKLHNPDHEHLLSFQPPEMKVIVFLLMLWKMANVVMMKLST